MEECLLKNISKKVVLGMLTFVDVSFSEFIVECNIKLGVLNEAPRKHYGNIKVAQTENKWWANRKSQGLGKWRAMFEGWGTQGWRMRCAQEVEDRNKDQRVRKENRIKHLSPCGVELAHLPEHRTLRRSLLFLEYRAWLLNANTAYCIWN